MVAINEMPMARRKRELRRVRKTVTNGGLAGDIPNGTTDSCWFGWQTMEERNPSGGTDTAIKQYVWGTYIDECIQINLLQAAGPQGLPSRHYYLLQDTLYRAMALTNSGGEIQEAYDNDAYGNTLIFTGPGADNTWFTDDDLQSSYGANDIIYCGYRYDAETDNYYVRNRYYSPVLGRWLTRDPIGYRGGINLYGYVESEPVGNVDASGFAWGFYALAGLAMVGLGGPEDPLADITTGWLVDQGLSEEEAEALAAARRAAAAAIARRAALAAAWAATCRGLYAAYKSACDSRGKFPCRRGMFCDEYPPAIAVREACAVGRAAYINAGCDVIFPTTKNHLGEMLNAWQAVERCIERSKGCRKRPACPTPTP